VKPTFLLVELFDIDVFDVKTPFRWAILTFVSQPLSLLVRSFSLFGQHLQTNLGEPLVLQKNMRKTKLNHQMANSLTLFYRQVSFLDKNSTWINDTWQFFISLTKKTDKYVPGTVCVNLAPHVRSSSLNV